MKAPDFAADYHPLPISQQPLTPHESFKQMAQEVCSNANIARDFLRKCEACGLPIEDRLAELESQTTFCQNFLSHFYGIPPV